MARNQPPHRPSGTSTNMSRTESTDSPICDKDLDRLSRDELEKTAEQYARTVQESYPETPISDIDLPRISWTASSQLCRSGAYCETTLNDPPTHTIVLSYPGYQVWGWDRVMGIIRHELAHVVVNEQYGEDARPHGPEFCQAADTLDAPLRGEEPVPYRYKLYCSRCGSMMDGLYQASDRIRNPWHYQSSCCEVPLEFETRSEWP